ncbi:lipopolysaccharide core biosynthesis glucosyltransferase [Anopheles sinensis]|uniref:Lipopolysaccharide core biosynthesis glucosyltransferase n=1 Tax=Anopheles sinensis TaxID=74873 RepID=A0A084WEK7_ANOSI|nr:lipopolysaccharide core biosynthesis glucosyltransferase [Anopheles sinensis]
MSARPHPPRLSDSGSIRSQCWLELDWSDNRHTLQYSSGRHTQRFGASDWRGFGNRRRKKKRAKETLPAQFRVPNGCGVRSCVK